MARQRRERRARGPVVSIDTSCLIALVWAEHEHHSATTTIVSQRLDAGAELALAGHALLEAYSVLTRLPAPHRQMVTLRIEGYEVAEIAQQTKRSKRSVERILQEARKRLAYLLEEE